MAIGRPREFDKQQALGAALNVFWRKGYEGATLPDLTRAMGINRPSLYAAFGNKEQLFRAAMDCYVAQHAGFLHEALAAPTAREVARRVWQATIDLVSGTRTPRGCLLVQGALACGDEGEAVRREAAKRRLAAEAALRARFERARAEGDLPADIHPADLARYVAAVMHGMAVQAASGASRKELQRAAALALRGWPS